MTIRVTITKPGVTDGYGIAMVVGTTYTVEENFGLSLIQQGRASDTDDFLGERVNAPFDEVVYPGDPVGLSSDGTSLVSGDGTILSIAEKPYIFDAVTVSGAANTSEQILKQYVLPANFLTTCNYVRLAYLVSKSATSENMTLRFRLGTAGTTSDAQLVSQTAPSSATRSNAGEFHFFAASSTQIRHLGSAPLGGMVSGNQTVVPPVNTTVPDMVANALYLSITAQMATGAETPTVNHIVLERR